VFLALRYVMVTSVIASLSALVVVAVGYREPERGRTPRSGSLASELGAVVRGFREALSNARFAAFLVIFAGFYFMVVQFYATFPKYVTRHISSSAPLEIITLVNPALIVAFQVVSGRMIARFLPADGPRSPLVVWAAYAGLGLACTGAMLVYRRIFARESGTSA
jgi:proton-dependent oligopeptide transporter, POT family